MIGRMVAEKGCERDGRKEEQGWKRDVSEGSDDQRLREERGRAMMKGYEGGERV